MSSEQMGICDLEGEEHENVQIFRGLLPSITEPEYTVKWASL